MTFSSAFDPLKFDGRWAAAGPGAGAAEGTAVTGRRRVPAAPASPAGYGAIRGGIVDLMQAARIAAARNVNALMTASYREIGRRIVEAEQKSKRRAGYREQLIERLAGDLTLQFGRGFSRQNLWQMRAFFLTWPAAEILQTVSGESAMLQTASGPLRKAKTPFAQSPATVTEAIAFIGRQKRLRIDDTWFRSDLVFFHRRLRCLVIVDLKVGKFSYADAGQMHVYLNYARANWMHDGENPPVGLIPCSEKGAAEVHYALEGLPNKVLAAQYQTVLPSEEQIARELAEATRMLEKRKAIGSAGNRGNA